MEMEKIQPGEPNENGDVEQSHRRFKEAVEQALLLRGSRDFESREAYERFLRELVASSECRPPEAAGRGVAATAASAGAAAGELQAAVGAGGHGQPDPRGPQHLFGSQPVDRREGRGAAVRGARRGLVRPEGGGAISTAAWAEEASRSTTGTSSTGWCGSRGRLRTTLPGRAVSHQPLPHGLRRLAGSAAGARPQGVFGDSLPGGTPERDGGGRGVANASGQRPARDPGGGRGVGPPGRGSSGGHRGDRRGSGPVGFR